MQDSFAVIVACATLAALRAGAAEGPKAPTFRDAFDHGLDHWLVERWEEDRVQVRVEDGKLRVDTQSPEHGVMVWLKREVPKDFVFEYDFTPLSRSGFFLIFFSQKGLKAEDILGDEMQKERSHRTLFQQYTMGRSGYHISYRRNEEGNCNLRKNPGLKLLRQQVLKQPLPAGKTVHVRLTQHGGRIRLEVGGQVFMEYTDADKPWQGGRIGLRQVYDSSGAYANVTLTALAPAE